MSGPRIALTPIAVPTVVGDYSAAFSGLTISSEVQVALEKGATAATKVAIFGTNDGTIASGSIAGTFNEAIPATWPNAGVDVRFLGYVRGGATSNPITAQPNSLLFIEEGHWEPAYIALRVLGVSAQNLDVSGIGDPTGTGGTAWLVGGQATSGAPAILGPNNGDSFQMQAGGAIPYLDANGVDTSIYSGTEGAMMVRGGSTGLVLSTSGNGPITLGNGIGTGGITIGGGGISSKITMIGDTVGASPLSMYSGTAGLDLNSTGAGGIRLTPGITGAIDVLPRNAGAGNTTLLRFFELAANGSNFIGLKAPDAVAANVTLILPIADATVSGQVLSSDAAGQLSFGSGITLASGALTLTQGSGAAATLGSNGGAASLALRAGTGALTIIRNGVTWSWPNAQETVNQALVGNGAGVLSFQSFNKCSFGATVSVVTQAAQFIPPGSGITTSTTLNPGSNQAGSGTVSTFRCSFIGDVLNVAQTVTAVLLKNGTAVTGASIAGIAAQAGAQTGTVTFTPVAFVAGDLFTATILPSAILTAILTNVTAAAV